LNDSTAAAEKAFLAWLAARENNPSKETDSFREALNAEAYDEFDKLVADFQALRKRVGATQPNLMAGRELGPFQLIRKLGSGAVGMVWEARDTRLGRHVALKVLFPHPALSERIVRRFHQEAEATAKLRHPNLVTLWSAGNDDSLHYLAQELIGNGHTLADVIRERQDSASLPPNHWREIAAHIAAIADGLAHAHHHGILHRDIKPSNILFDESGTVRLADFGLAKVTDQNLSLTDEVVGTPFYMSPEQSRGSKDASKSGTDIFSIGSVLYECLCLQRPFQGERFEAIAFAIQQDHPRRPSQILEECPPELEWICLKALQKLPSKRYESAHALAQDLHRFLRGEPVLAPPTSFRGRIWRLIRRTLSDLGFVTFAPFWRRPVRAALSSTPTLPDALGQIENRAALHKWVEDLRDAGLTKEADVLQKLLVNLPHEPHKH